MTAAQPTDQDTELAHDPDLPRAQVVRFAEEFTTAMAALHEHYGDDLAPATSEP